MRYNLANTSGAKRVSQDLRYELAVLGIKLPLSASQDLVARMFGYAHWKQMSAEAGTREPSLPNYALLDQAGGEEEFVERIDRQTAVLADRFPLITHRARDIVHTLAATGPWSPPIDLSSPPDPTVDVPIDMPECAGFASVFSRGGEIGIRYALSMADGSIRTPLIFCAEGTSDAARSCLSEALRSNRDIDSPCASVLYSMHLVPWGDRDDKPAVYYQLFLRNLDPEAFAAFRSVCGLNPLKAGKDLFDLLRVPGRVGDRRRKFALQFPLLAMAGLITGSMQLQAIDTAATPARAKSALIQSLTGMDARQARKAGERLAQWDYFRHRRPTIESVTTLLQVLGGVFEDITPTSQEEASRFLDVLEMLVAAVPQHTPGRPKILQNLMAETRIELVPEWWLRDARERPWGICADKLNKAAKSLIEEHAGKRKNIVDPAKKVFGNAPLVFAQFAKDVLLIGDDTLTDDALGFAAVLFLAGAGMRGLRRLVDGWIAGEVHHAASLPSASERLAVWRPFLSPALAAFDVDHFIGAAREMFRSGDDVQSNGIGAAMH